jgi:hypothetical protein
MKRDEENIVHCVACDKLLPMFLFGGDLFFSFGRFKKKRCNIYKRILGMGGGRRGDNPPNLLYFKELFFEIFILKGWPQS